MEEMKVKVEIKVEDIISELTANEQDELAFNIFDKLPDADKAGYVKDCFASLDDKSQKAVLDYIISELLTDEQFHILTEYFKKHGK